MPSLKRYIIRQKYTTAAATKNSVGLLKDTVFGFRTIDTTQPNIQRGAGLFTIDRGTTPDAGWKQNHTMGSSQETGDAVNSQKPTNFLCDVVITIVTVKS